MTSRAAKVFKVTCIQAGCDWSAERADTFKCLAALKAHASEAHDRYVPDVEGEPLVTVKQP